MRFERDVLNEDRKENRYTERAPSCLAKRKIEGTKHPRHRKRVDRKEQKEGQQA